MTKPPQLQRLKAEWYKKLKDSGFEDIEDTNSPRELLKSWHSTYFFRKYTPEMFAQRQEYYEKAGRFLATHPFQYQIHKEIWQMHTEGLSIRTISASLKDSGTPMHKDAVHKVLKALIKAMKVSRSD